MQSQISLERADRSDHERFFLWLTDLYWERHLSLLSWSCCTSLLCTLFPYYRREVLQWRSDALLNKLLPFEWHSLIRRAAQANDQSDPSEVEVDRILQYFRALLRSDDRIPLAVTVWNRLLDHDQNHRRQQSLSFPEDQ